MRNITASSIFGFGLGIFFSLLGLSSGAQDTIVVRESIHFKENQHDKYFFKGFSGDYGREDIIFSDTHHRVEYCYYEDEVRTCFGHDYYLLDDSTLMVNDSTSVWHFSKVGANNYYLTQTTDSVVKSGYAESLMPLVFSSDVFVVSPANGDTLWVEKYSYPKSYRPDGYLKIEPYFSELDGRFYEYYEVDTPPLLSNGDSIPAIDIEYLRGYCFGEPLVFINLITCIINTSGHVSGVELAFGNIEFSCHPETYAEIVTKLNNLGPFVPAVKNNQPVAVRWFVKINTIHDRYGIQRGDFDTDEIRMNHLKWKNSKSGKNDFNLSPTH